jgi:sialate O-acetylesterase
MAHGGAFMKWIASLLPVIFFGGFSLRAEIRLPAVISDQAMLQAGKPVAIWGWAEPGALVKVAFTGGVGASPKSFSATADGTGKWEGQLPALKAGTAGKLKITSDKGSRKTVNDVLVGEVWLGGGQSNMVYTVGGDYGRDRTSPEEVAEDKQNIAVAQAEASHLKEPIRYFEVTSKGADEPGDDVKGHWVEADPKNVLKFSAAAWNFAVALQDKLHEPIGLIVSCVGGTPVQCWMSRETLAGTSVGAAIFERHEKALVVATPAMIAKHDADLKVWEAANPTPALQFKNWSKKPRPIYTKDFYQAPVRLYNGMIHGLEPYTLRGIIWFQADGNSGFPLEYSELFQALIKEWRADWKEELPFYFVEMNNMQEVTQTRPVQPNALSVIREQQHGALQLPGVGMVVCIDLGTTNPHFPNKKPVGER